MQPIKAALMVNWERIPGSAFRSSSTLRKWRSARMPTMPRCRYRGWMHPSCNSSAERRKRSRSTLFDSTEDGTGPGAKSVVKDTEKMYQLAKVLPHLHAPPICTLVWSHSNFPGSQVSVQLGKQPPDQLSSVWSRACGTSTRSSVDWVIRYAQP